MKVVVVPPRLDIKSSPLVAKLSLLKALFTVRLVGIIEVTGLAETEIVLLVVTVCFGAQCSIDSRHDFRVKDVVIEACHGV